ncbi:MAG: phosphomannomutase/phosphoglucomutase, partial [Gammaproteobacteria bacterium]|nr:phosphomannomutase/phosphoglucomutase [Gammaproteobacteria bacterium]
SAELLFPSALKVRLLRPGQYRADNTSSPPLSFGSIAMLNKIERSAGPVAAEVFLFGSDNQHIVYVERVKNQGDQLIGIVHLSLSVALFEQALSSLGLVDGYLEVQQSASGSQLVLASVGDSALKAGLAGSASISGSRWTVSYWAPHSLVGADMVSVGMGISPAALFGVAALLLLAMVMVVLAKRKQPEDNAVTTSGKMDYQGAILAIMDGTHPGMEKLIKHFPGTKGSSNAEARPSEALAEGEDITSIASMESVKQQAQDADVFDITQSDEDTKDAAEKPGETENKTPVKQDSASESPTTELPSVIFRKYDVRGKVENELTAGVVRQIGMSAGTQAEGQGTNAIIVGRDGRHSSPELAKSLIEGLTSTGRDVIDIGIVPTPVLYFATHHFETGNGIMVTGSHNGPEYNGLKIVLGGNTLSEDKILEIQDRIIKKEFSAGSGNVSTEEILPEYIRRISEDIPVAFGNSYKLVVDCGNGAASVAASQLYKAMGHDVVDLYCELDGNFPNHHPDPSQPENLEDLINKIKETGADLGFAFDGDGDRLGVVDANGNILWPDSQMMVFARDVLTRNQGAEIIFDVKCSKHLKTIIEDSGGKPLMWKTGHSLIKSKMKEVNAPLAGEMSGHIFFGERWYGFDDALYSGARMLEILTSAKVKPAEFFAELPQGESTPELRIDLPETEHAKFMSDLKEKISFDDAEIITIDGFRVEFADGWGLIRPSNTTPCLVARFEADSPEALTAIQGKFKELFLSVNPDLSIPF